MTIPGLSQRRAALTGLSVVGTVAYAASFAVCDSRHTLAPLATAVGVAAAVAWVTFMVLIRHAVGAHAFERWIDLCLRTQAVGIAALVVGAFANVTFFTSADWLGSKPMFPVFIVVHAGLLALGDALMGLYFVTASDRHGLSVTRAVAVWVFGLNGIFAAVLTLLVGGRVLS